MAEDLRQADLSKLTLAQMNPAQRAEMRRRLAAFIEAFKPPAPPVEAPPKSVRKWVPGMKA